jgi:hypothetical protein
VTSVTTGATRYRAFKAALRVGQWAALPTAAARSLPDFLLLGGQRCGTTSLYRHLVAHDGIAFPRRTKGVHWFDVAYDRSAWWYRSNFPLDVVRQRATARLGYPLVVGEACPYYLFHPAVPGRVKEVMPEARLVAILRDPIERAWSAYHHERRRGYEDLSSFETALDAEPERLAGAEEVLRRPDGRHFSHQHHGYVARGRYDEQIRRWWDAFPRDQVLVAYTADLEGDPDTVLSSLHRFLGVPSIPPASAQRWNQQATADIPAPIRQRLADAFAESDQWLVDHLPQRPPWLR